MAKRGASGKTIAVLAARLPEMMGGSADLAPSTHTNIAGAGNFEPENWAGRNMHFGIREHAMGAILNGMALHRGRIPYGATFLVFSDYMRPPMRLAAMNGLPVIMLFTHDSLAMGEDGPTHQPIEQLLGLRSIPGTLSTVSLTLSLIIVPILAAYLLLDASELKRAALGFVPERARPKTLAIASSRS